MSADVLTTQGAIASAIMILLNKRFCLEYITTNKSLSLLPDEIEYTKRTIDAAE